MHIREAKFDSSFKDNRPRQGLQGEAKLTITKTTEEDDAANEICVQGKVLPTFCLNYLRNRPKECCFHDISVSFHNNDIIPQQKMRLQLDRNLLLSRRIVARFFCGILRTERLVGCLLV